MDAFRGTRSEFIAWQRDMRRRRGGFDFASLNGYAGNWDASVGHSLTLTGDNIDTIADLSPAGDDVSYVAGGRITNLGSIAGRPAAASASDGNRTHNGASKTMPTEGAALVVARISTFNVAHGLIGAGPGGTGPGFFLEGRGNGRIKGYVADGTGFFDRDHATVHLDGDVFIAAIRWDATNMVLWDGLTKETHVHGLTFVGGAVTTTVFGTNSLGLNAFGPGDWGQGLYYDQDNTDADIELAIQGLADKWGITI